MSETATPLLQALGLCKVYGDGEGEVVALQSISFNLEAGKTLAVVGASGAGKSTLLHLLGGLDKPTSGEVLFDGRSLYALTDHERTEFRNRSLGFVYQFHHLLREFTAQENVAMPLLIRRDPKPEALAKAQAILEKVGLGHRLRHTPGMLSGGERQRVAIARALITQPKCILADEPTGNLDRATANKVFDVLIQSVAESGCSLVLVTHDSELAARCDSILHLS